MAQNREMIVLPSEDFNSNPHDDPQPSHTPEVHGVQDSKGKGLSEAYDTNEVTDFVIVTNNGEIPCHSKVLKSQSPVIKAMLEMDMTEAQQKKVTIDHFPAQVVEKLVEYMYHGTVNVPSELMEDMIFAADYFQIEKEKFLEKCMKNEAFLNAANVLRFREIAEHYIKSPKLALAVKRKIVSTFHGVMQTESFLNLDPVEIGRLVKEMGVDRVCKDYLVDGVLRWVNNSTNEDAFDWLKQEDFDFLVSLVLDQWVIAPDESEVTAARGYRTFWDTLGDWSYRYAPDWRSSLSSEEKDRWRAHAVAQLQAEMPREKSKYPSLHLYKTFQQKLKTYRVEIEGKTSITTSEKSGHTYDNQQDNEAKLEMSSEANVDMDSADDRVSPPPTSDATEVEEANTTADTKTADDPKETKKASRIVNMDSAEQEEESRKDDDASYIDKQFDRLLSSKRFKHAVGVELLKLVDTKKCSKPYVSFIAEILRYGGNSLPAESSHLLDLPHGIGASLLATYHDMQNSKVLLGQGPPRHVKSLTLMQCDMKYILVSDDYKTFIKESIYYLFRRLTNTGLCETPRGFMVTIDEESNMRCTGYHSTDTDCNWGHVDCNQLTKKEHHGMVFSNQRVYIIGGYHDGQWCKEVVVVNFQDMEWYYGPDLPRPFKHPFAVEHGECIYVMHGYQQLAVLDAVGFMWTELAPLPDYAPEARITSDGKRIYVAGGEKRVCFAYSPEEDTWETLSQPLNVHSCGALCFHDGRLFLLGGEGSTLVEEYDIKKDVWRVSDLKLPHPLSNHSAIHLEARDLLEYEREEDELQRMGWAYMNVGQ